MFSGYFTSLREVSMRHLAVIALVVLLAAPAAQCADRESGKVFRSR